MEAYQPRDKNLTTQFRDHASLFTFGTALARLLEENGTASSMHAVDPDTLKAFHDQDANQPRESLHRMLATGIYKTQDLRFYHVHG